MCRNKPQKLVSIEYVPLFHLPYKVFVIFVKLSCPLNHHRFSIYVSIIAYRTRESEKYYNAIILLHVVVWTRHFEVYDNTDICHSSPFA